MLAILFESACGGNTYPATISTLATALGKLGRISKVAAPLYRPVGSAYTLPAGFVDPSIAAGVEGWSAAALGGVEFGCLRLSAQRDVLMAEASVSASQLLLEIEQVGHLPM